MQVFTNNFSPSFSACLSSLQSGITLCIYLTFSIGWVSTHERVNTIIRRVLIANELNSPRPGVMMNSGAELGASPEEHGWGQSHWDKRSCRMNSGQWGSQGSLIWIAAAPRRAWHLAKASNCLDAITKQFSKRPLIYDPWHPYYYRTWLMMRGKRIQSW